MTGNRRQNVDTSGNDAFLEAVRRELDHSCEALDGYTLSRLNQIRHRAIEHKRSGAGSLWWSTGGFVTACVLVLAISLGDRSGLQSDPGVTAPLEDLEIMTATESLELFEDFEFYQWLAENENPA